MHTRHQSTHFSVEELRPPIHDVAKLHSDQNRVLIIYKSSFSVIDHDLSYASINSVVAQLSVEHGHVQWNQPRKATVAT